MRQFSPEALLSELHQMRGLTGELILLGVLALVISSVLCWAVFIRKRRPWCRSRSHRHHHHHQPHFPSDPVPSQAQVSEPARSRHHRRRKRRREHRPRNPTLAETGGLPPLPAEHPSEPFP